jgi:hypothetical protein
MQHYFFDIHWNDETILDEEGADYFDEGSALYYGRIVANRIARGSVGDTIRVHVRNGAGRLLSILIANQFEQKLQAQSRVKAIVERDLARLCAVAS